MYVEIPKTYDRIHKENLVNKLKEFHFQHKLIKLAKVSVVEIFVKVKIGSIEWNKYQRINYASDKTNVSHCLRTNTRKNIYQDEMNIILQGFKTNKFAKIKLQDGLKSLFCRLGKTSSCKFIIIIS